MMQGPPSFEEHIITLCAKDDSKITGVSVYSGRAEVTRLFKFSIKTGQNKVTINGLPNALDAESLRVEGRGAATIHDVTVGPVRKPPPPTSSQELKDLYARKKSLQKALDRTKKALNSLETYLASLHTENVTVSDLTNVIDGYEATGEKLDNKVSDLEEQIIKVDQDIAEEVEKISGQAWDDRLNMRATIGFFADVAGDIEIVLIYAVSDATWSAGYDIRVNMQTKGKPVTLVYKGAIVQDTGEDWNDITLTLETATPTFGQGIPSLDIWSLSVYQPRVFAQSSTRKSAVMHNLGFVATTSSRSGRVDESLRERVRERSASLLLPPMEFRNLSVSSKGNISATFDVPGKITIPSDNVAHNVTIAELQLDAVMSWVSVPKKDAKTHLSAKIKNASEYTLLSGNASVYVDGSFISRSNVPNVSPEESFDCPLGLDPSIRITYHPRSKNATQAGFYSKANIITFSQRITVFNTKSITIEKLKVIDQFPVSEDSQIQVKLVSPALTLPGKENTVGGPKVSAPLVVSKGVIAQWDSADENVEDVEALGKDGKFNWVCSVPPQGKLNLLLQWEVTSPLSTTVAGLNTS